MNPNPVRILLVDDHQMLLQSLRHLLNQRPGLEVVGEDLADRPVLEQVRTLKPEVIVMDIHMPDQNGLELSQAILAEFPQQKIVGLSADPNLALVQQALQAGIRGYVLKSHGPDELIRAIQCVLDHRLYLCPEVAAGVLGDYVKHVIGKAAAPQPELSDRERHLLRLVAEGKRNKEIADELQVGLASVETYRSRLMRKLGCTSAVELARYAIREGITTV